MSSEMMRMMMGMMSAKDGPAELMTSPDHVEGRIAFMQAELKLTDAQQPQWKAVADAMRNNAKLAKDAMAGMGGAMMPAGSAAMTPLKRIDHVEQMLSARLEGLRQLKTAMEPFYATLSEAQKAVADKLLLPAPMGMM
ncbi:Spy/CpxP family protein refolding chaperone [Mesorhizobium sp.]|uniref:Spy/CpxP family protein refolding chaperone n=2 Tax=unclassified Mesorhizobium TaxID=325217 RepID=UPI0025C68ECE|nr:Spy/CpxP family protein refolding chaperone [Mesorhizobium sp.]